MKEKRKINKVEFEYNASNEIRKEVIKSEPNKFTRFLKWLHHLIIFPFKRIVHNIKDWRTVVIFVIVFILTSSEVWVPYLVGFICWNNEPLRHSMFGVGSACRLFWAGPGTPFMVIVIGLTIAVKGIFNKIRARCYERQNSKLGS